MALTTGAFLSDSGNPSNGNGSDGDHYRDTANQNLWFKTGGSWTLVGNVNDDTPDGVGTFWLHGSGVPLNANGENNNYYRNTANQDIWFKVGGFWTLIFGTTSMTSATSGVRSINGIQPDAGGDVTLLVEDLGGTGPSIDDHVAAIDPHGDRAYAEGLVVGLWDDRGNFDASGGDFPIDAENNGSGPTWAILKGDIWTISSPGTLPGSNAVVVGDTIRALQDSPGQTPGNWAIQRNNIGYVAENAANKSTSSSLGTSDTLYPTQKAVKDYVDMSQPRAGDTISRGGKFGNHIQIGAAVPNCPYQGSSSGSQALMSVASVEALTNRGNIADCALWEMNSNIIDTATEVGLFTFAGSTLYPQQRWRSGAKMQFLASLALATVVPTTENFVYRIGLANVANSDLRSLDPFAGAVSGVGNQFSGCAALFIADNTSGFWQCKSGQKLSTETTVTSVAYAAGEFAVFHVVVTPSGVVEFRINGTLVATHSGAGAIPDGAWLGEGVAVRNIAATTTAKKGFYLDEFQFRLTLPSARPGFAFV